ncbi:MAG: LamG domain-containing protein [Candidatus Rokuibacteriota bacterium]
MALSFSGTTQDINFGSPAGLDNLNTLTFAAWVYPVTVTVGSQLWDKSDAAFTTERRSSITDTGAFRVAFGRATAYAVAQSVVSTMTANAWQFVAFTWDGTAAPKLYRGTLATAIAELAYATSTAGAGAIHNDSAESMRIGRAEGFGQFNGGRIARVQVWNRVLTLNELLQQQFCPHLTSSDVLLCELGLNGVGTQFDRSGNGHHGTVSGSPTVADHVPLPFWRGRLMPRLVTTAAGSVPISASDSLSLSLGEATAVRALHAVSDSLALSLGEAVGLISRLSRTETLTLSLGEAVALLGRLTRTETLSLTLSDASAVMAQRAVSDTLSLSLSDNAAVVTGSAMPTFVAAGALVAAVGTVTPALPAGLQTNDLLLLVAESANQAVTIPTPNGGTWMEVANSPQGMGTAGQISGARLTMFWSRYNGTQGNPTTNDPGNHIGAKIFAFRGCETSGNPWNVTAGDVPASGTANVLIPGATTTVDQCLVVLIATCNLPDTWSALTNADLATLTERFQGDVVAGNDGDMFLATGEKASAGSYGATSVTITGGNHHGRMSIALMPPQAASTPISASDTVSLALSEATAVTAERAVSDSLSVSLGEAVSLLVRLSRSDTLALSLSETTAVRATLTRTESLALSLSEVVSLTGRLSRTDSLSVSLGELSAITVQLPLASETLTVSLGEVANVIATGAITKAASDTLSVSLTDASVLTAQLTQGDTLALSLSEATSLLARLSRADALTVSLSEVVSLISRLSRSDSLSVSLGEAVSLLVRLTGLADSLGLSLQEAAALRQAISAADSLSVSVIESPAGLVITTPGTPQGSVRFSAETGLLLALFHNAALDNPRMSQGRLE